MSLQYERRDVSNRRQLVCLLKKTNNKENIKALCYWPFVMGSQRRSVDSRHKWSITQKMFQCHSVMVFVISRGTYVYPLLLRLWLSGSSVEAIKGCLLLIGSLLGWEIKLNDSLWNWYEIEHETFQEKYRFGTSSSCEVRWYNERSSMKTYGNMFVYYFNHLKRLSEHTKKYYQQMWQKVFLFLPLITSGYLSAVTK